MATVNLGDIEATIRLRDEMTSKLGEIQGQLSGVVGGIGEAILKANLIEKAVGSIIGFAKEAFEAAGDIADLAGKTGLSVEAIQIYGQAAELAGGTTEQFADAVFRLGVNIEKGTKPVQAAIASLGLSFADLKALAPEQQFEMIASALHATESATERNRLGVDLFGRQWANVAPAVVEGIEKIRESTVTASEAQIKALDAAADRWDKFIGDLSRGTTQQLGQMVLDIEAAWSGFTKLFDDIAAKDQWIADQFLAMKNAVVTYAMQLYQGVKTWMLDRFTAVVNGIRDKVAAVTGFFAEMYDKVVGNSFVPDMIERVGAEFGRLGDLMERPTERATRTVTGLFGGMFRDITGKFTEWGNRAGSLVSEKLGGPLGTAFGSLTASVTGLIGSLVTSGISTLISMAVPLLISGLKKLGSIVKNAFNFFGSAPEWSFDPEKPSGGGPDPFNPNNPYVDPDTGDPYDPGNDFEPGQNSPRIRNYATGGYVPAKAGGTLARIGEGGEGEYVIPESKAGGVTVNMYISTLDVDSFRKIRETLTREVRLAMETNLAGERTRMIQALGGAV